MKVFGAAVACVPPAAFLAGGAAARFALWHPPARIATDLAQPLVVVTAWGPLGATLFALLACAIGAAALSALALALWFAPSLRTALAVAAVTLIAALSWPVAFSSDVYAYAAYGDAVVHGLNPYLPAPAAMHDAYFDAARWQWGGSTFPACVYGPFFVAFAALVDAVAGGLPAALWLFRIGAALAFLASVAVFDQAFGAHPLRRTATALYALNPVALWSVAEGHNDAFLLLVVGAAFALARTRPRLAGALLGLAPAVKAVALAAAATLFAPRGVANSRAVRVAYGVAFAVAAALALPLHLAGYLARPARVAAPAAFSATAVFGAGPVLLVAAALVVMALRGIARGERAAAAGAGIALWIAIPNPYPWYALWLVPAAALGWPATAACALWAVTICGAVRYLPEAFGNPGNAATLTLTLFQYAPLAAVPALRALVRRQKGRSEDGL